MRPAYLRLVEPVESHSVSSESALLRLTQMEPDGTPMVLLNREAEILRRTLTGRSFLLERLDAIVQELRDLDQAEPEDDEIYEEDELYGAWRRALFAEYVVQARAGLRRPVSLDNALLSLEYHRRDVERETGKACRRSLLRAALAAFLTPHDPNRMIRLAG